MVTNAISRRFEKQADMTVVQYTGAPEKLAAALEGVYANWREKHPYVMCLRDMFEKYAWMFDGHPNLRTRTKYLRALIESES